MGLSIPVILVYIWDSAPRYQAMRKLRNQGIQWTSSSVFRAIEERNLDRLKLLQQAGAPLNELDAQQRPVAVAAVVAANNGPNEILRYLASLKNLDLDRRDANGFPALSHAISSNDGDAVQALVAKVRDPNVAVPLGAPAAKEPSGQVPPVQDVSPSTAPTVHALIKATQERDGTLLRCLLGHPLINVDCQDIEKKWTPLHHAVHLPVASIAELLFSGAKKPNPNLADTSNRTPLYYTLSTDKPAEERAKLVGLLLDNGAKLEERDLVHFLFLTIDRQEEETLRRFLAHGVDVNTKNPETGMNLLDHSVDRGVYGCVLELLNAGADPKQSFQRAILCGASDTAELLASKGHFQGAPPASLVDLMEKAILSGNGDSVAMLLRMGADPNTQTSFGQRPLTLSILARNAGAVDHLLAKGAEFQYIVESPVSEELLKVGAHDKYTLGFLQEDSGMTPFFLAALTAQERIGKALVDKGANTQTHTIRRKRYPVEVAAARSHVHLQQMALGRTPGDESRKVVISLSKQKATIFVNGQPTITTSCSTGKPGYRTKSGSFVITNKYKQWTSTLYHSSMPYFQRLSCDAFGMHSGVVPGYPASHGCIRLPYSRARELFGVLRVGDPVEIQP